MVSWVPHLLIPTLVALAFLRSLDRRYVYALAPVVFLPDLDYFWPGEHRVLTHSILWPLACLGACWFLWRRARRAGGATAAAMAGGREAAGTPPRGQHFLSFATQPGPALGFLLASYYLASHILLDIFAGGVVVFWPVWNLNFYADYEIYIDTKTNQLEQAAEAGSSVGAPEVDPHYPWLTYEHTAILVFVAAVLLPWAVHHVRLRLRARRNRARDPTLQRAGQKP